MRAVSLFSGVGGFELGFDRAGIETVLQAENDPKALSVLERHWPDVERVTDVRDIRDGEADLVYGGFPCQPFSVAGKRAGDRDDRNLWPEFRRIVSELRPRWVVAENVPGLLSIDDGRFFGAILDDLGELGFEGVAYAILDAQHFGVPQRRRRVFIVAGPGRRSVEQVLAICEGCAGHPTAGRATGEDVAGSPGVGAGARGAVANPLGTKMRNDLDNETYVARPTLGASHGVDNLATVARPLRANRWGGADSHGDEGNIVASPISASAGHHGHSSPRGDGADNLIPVHVPDIAHALTARDAKGPLPSRDIGTTISDQAGVRRLTPRECERLQGWPDDHTRYTADGTEIADSHRYRMIGNGVASPVVEWIGRRLVAVDEWT